MSGTVRGQPPGRAGRVWLARRSQVAQRGAGLLETKLRILAAEERRFAMLVQRSERAWVRAVADADVWMARARMLSGQRGLRLTSPTARADVRITEETTMGVRHAARASVALPPPEADEPTPDSSALALAATAYREALRLGAEHAAAVAARDAVRAETASTRRRLRAVQKHWLPTLAEAQQTLADALEEAEREDGVRMRWSVAHVDAGRRA